MLPGLTGTPQPTTRGSYAPLMVALTEILDDPLSHLDAADPAIRRLAVSALAGRAGDRSVHDAVAPLLGSDPDGIVRAEAAEILAGSGPRAVPALLAALDDGDVRVVEAAITSLGEMRARPAVHRLLEAAENHADRLVREAAVAALGAIGDATAIPILLAVLASGPPQVRRRAVAALTVFDDPAIEPALRLATEDRNPMVREVAAMVVGPTGGRAPE